MKAVFFNKPLELSLDVDGESWKQGDEVAGKLTLKNHSNEKINLSQTGMFLALGDVKKVKAKEPGAFKALEKSLFETGANVSAGGEKMLSFSFQLESDCPITEKKQSLYLVAGENERLESSGSLQLAVLPAGIIDSFLRVFVDMFRFKVKGLKNKKDFIEASMAVPATKEYTGVQDFKLLLRMKEDNLETRYLVKLKKLSYEDASAVKTKDVKVDFKQTLPPSEYKIYGDAVNQGGISKRIREALDKVSKG